MAPDPRIERYAHVLVDDCVDVQPGWQVLVRAQPLARPLYEEVIRQIAGRGAYALPRLSFGPFGGFEPTWLRDAPEQLLREIPSVERFGLENIDSFIVILAPENTRDGAEVPQERVALLQAALRPLSMPFMSDQKPWVGCQFPTHALAQDAGMSLHEFEEFLFGAVLIDWDALETEMRRIADRFDAADEIRIVADGTDLRLSLAGRKAKISAAGANMPSGEFFFSPIEDSAEGVIHYSEYAACYLGHEVSGVRLVFREGRIVNATADSDEEFLLKTLDTDDGARRLGELGIGCNPGIQRHLKNTLFDEKIEGTIHLAVGQSYPATGGTNESAIHWDMVKELRHGGRIELDGQVVQESGKWR